MKQNLVYVVDYFSKGPLIEQQRKTKVIKFPPNLYAYKFKKLDTRKAFEMTLEKLMLTFTWFEVESTSRHVVVVQ